MLRLQPLNTKVLWISKEWNKDLLLCPLWWLKCGMVNETENWTTKILLVPHYGCRKTVLRRKKNSERIANLSTLYTWLPLLVKWVFPWLFNFLLSSYLTNSFYSKSPTRFLPYCSTPDNSWCHQSTKYYVVMMFNSERQTVIKRKINNSSYFWELTFHEAQNDGE